LERGERIRIRKLTPTTLEAELVGEDHTIANLVAKYALNTPGVKYAAYTIPHILVSNPVLRIVTEEGVNPLDALEEALKRVLEDIADLKKQLREALGEEGA